MLLGRWMRPPPIHRHSTWTFAICMRFVLTLSSVWYRGFWNLNVESFGSFKWEYMCAGIDRVYIVECLRLALSNACHCLHGNGLQFVMYPPIELMMVIIKVYGYYAKCTTYTIYIVYDEQRSSISVCKYANTSFGRSVERERERRRTRRNHPKSMQISIGPFPQHLPSFHLCCAGLVLLLPSVCRQSSGHAAHEEW